MVELETDRQSRRRTYVYIYIYMYVCLCVCISIFELSVWEEKCGGLSLSDLRRKRRKVVDGTDDVAPGDKPEERDRVRGFPRLTELGCHLSRHFNTVKFFIQNKL